MKINQIWSELEQDNSCVQGFLIRRYSADIMLGVYAFVKYPEKQVGVCISLNDKIKVNITQFSNLEDIKIYILPSQNKTASNDLIFQLSNNQHRDVYAVLCEDLIHSICNETSDIRVVEIVLNRFEKWKSLFNKLNKDGLTPEEQRGLYGELHLLRKLLFKYDNKLGVVSSWVGTTKEARDFQNANWAIEVKTSVSNSHQKVHISSEMQLDTKFLEYLFLYHLSLERMQNSGETLNDIIDSVLDILKTDMIALNKFKSKLYEVGYFELHRNLYDNIGYHVRQDVFYKVENNFPRIEENDVRIGVGDVKYTILIEQCKEYSTDEEQIFKSITYFEG